MNDETNTRASIDATTHTTDGGATATDATNTNTGSTTERRSPNASRRTYLAGAGTLALTSVAGCLDWLTGGNEVSPYGQLGSGRGGRELAGTPMAEMPPLEGTIDVYSGRDPFLVGTLFDELEAVYDDLTIEPRYDSSTDLVNQIRAEGSNTSADVFFTVNAGALAFLASEGRTQAIPDDVLALGRDGYQDPDGQWIGTSGRARTVPYNTDALDESDVPDSIFEFAERDELEGQIGWAPTYGSCQDFVTAMRIMEGDERTREWLEAMVDHGAREYSSEFQVAEAVANGELLVGLTNHYYVVRVLDRDDDPPIDMTYTDGDAASFFNVAGAAVVDEADDPELAANFVRHLLSAEVQDYFAVSRTFEYPMIPELEPIDELPSFDALDAPEIDLAAFATADVTETAALMEDAGVL